MITLVKFFTASVTIGFLGSIFAFIVTGNGDPFDAGYVYIFSLLLIGVVIGYVTQKHFWLYPLGIYIGQVIYAMLQGSEWMFGAVTFLVFLFWTFPSAFFGSLVGIVQRRMTSRESMILPAIGIILVGMYFFSIIFRAIGLY